MPNLLSSLAIVALLASCSPTDPPTDRAIRSGRIISGTPSSVALNQSQLSSSQKEKIGRKIWQNESAGTINGLTAWNDGEAFPSLGIGHFIWYPQGQRGPFTESFPRFIAFANLQGKRPPGWTINRPCPWPDRASFMRDFNGPELTGLRKWLAANISIQTDFIIAKSRASLPKMLAIAGSSSDRVQTNYNNLSTTPNGQYALIDYVNFKGEGINPAERYRGQGWGLLQVLQEMRPTGPGQAAAAEFAAASSRVLSRRVANSGGKDQRWLAGWRNRCKTYAQPL
ncbi:MAG: hypothetical protein AAGC74_10140 [Verrucomicrobiota bacterium]